MPCMATRWAAWVILRGVQFWTAALNAGASRAAVTVGFSENQVHTASNILSENPANYGI